MEVNKQNTRILCQYMHELNEPATIKQITNHAISRMELVRFFLKFFVDIPLTFHD